MMRFFSASNASPTISRISFAVFPTFDRSSGDKSLRPLSITVSSPFFRIYYFYNREVLFLFVYLGVFQVFEFEEWQVDSA